jgi:hypothetical protein
VLTPERVEAGRESRDAAGADPHGVVDELGAERDFQLEEGDRSRLAPEPWHGDEAVKVRGPAYRRVVVDRVPTAEETGHDGLGDTRREACSDRGIGGGSAVFEDLYSRVGGGRMAGCDCASHARSLNPDPILR